ncbi:MAG: nucleoside-diphosphate sugar epimerase [Alphaproteobacteria bacterium]|nr:nucleoside-diphosphate sugar epimerase [Alphaproteobacteria bacterium]
MQSVGFQPADPIAIWAVSDGRAGIENQALGLAEAIGRRTPARIVRKHVRLRSPWAWLPPGFTPWPRHALTDESDRIDRPWPDIFIGCGRASIPFAMGMRSWTNGRTLVVQVQDPRVNPREFDIVLPPEHDGMEGANVVPLIGAPHRVTLERIAADAAAYPRVLPALPGPRMAVLIGGKSKRQDISARRARLIAQDLAALKMETGGSLLVTLSRRTGARARKAFEVALKPHAALYFEGEGPNPYFAMLAAADVILVTADSVNMAAEAAATGKPILLLPVDGTAGKLARFHEALVASGAARWHVGAYETWTYPPLSETDRAADIVLAALAKRRAS